ncbi:non-canonical purine NTP pyrophosphatase [Clostridia bacterium]|nr:non-canonical purine NTP pyrophosphatase [Clostridia bacterium]
MRELIFATNNKGKLAEAKHFLEPLGYNVKSLSEIEITRFEPVEIGETFSDNALIKAKALLSIIPQACVFADDSGLEVEALGGRPGVLSARYCEGTDNDRCLKILEEMKGIENRKASFACAVAFYCQQVNFGLTARIDGEIGTELIGKNGFGYDPIFIRNGKSFAEISQEEKNNCSHRGAALLQMAKILDDIVAKGLFLEVPHFE